MTSFLATTLTSLAPALDLLAQLVASAWSLAGTLAMILLASAAASYGVVLGILIATRRHGPISISVGRLNNIDLVGRRQGERE
ncbi:hypothetical protein [Xanthobacter sediminis]